jgi:GAF domain-containing protein
MISALSLLAVTLVRLGLQWLPLPPTAVSRGRPHFQGHLDHPLSLEGEDEVGQLGQAFEGMRVSLKARLDELNGLLAVSQGVASTLEFESAIRPVLGAALRTGACSARVALNPAMVPDLEGESGPAGFGMGPANHLYSELDEQLMALTRQQERIVLASLNRARLIRFAADSPRPGALIALALRHENQYYGVLWVAYDEPHNFPEDEIRFLTTLAGQTALAAANSRLYMNAEIGRQRLAAILASTPDPVLVTDQQNELLLANPAAWRCSAWASNGRKASRSRTSSPG